MAIDDFPPGGAAFDLGPVGDDQGATVPQAQQPAQAQAAQQPAQPQGIDPQQFMQMTTALIGQAGMAGENKPGWMQAVGHLTDAMKTHAEPEPPGEIWMAGHGDDIREFKSKAAFDQFNQTYRTAATKEQDTLGQYNKIITNRKLTLRDMAQQVRLLALQNDHGDIAAGAAGMSVDHVSKQVGDRMKAVQHLNTQADKIMQMADMQSKNGLMKKRDQLIQAVSSGRIPPGQEESVMTHIRSIGSALDQMAKAGGQDPQHDVKQMRLQLMAGQLQAQQQKAKAQNILSPADNQQSGVILRSGEVQEGLGGTFSMQGQLLNTEIARTQDIISKLSPGTPEYSRAEKSLDSMLKRKTVNDAASGFPPPGTDPDVWHKEISQAAESIKAGSKDLMSIGGARAQTPGFIQAVRAELTRSGMSGSQIAQKFAEMGANKTNLSKDIGRVDALKTAQDGMEKNMEILRDYAKRLNLNSSMSINTMNMAVQRQFGGTIPPGYETAILTVAREYAKLTSPAGAAAPTVSSMTDAERILNPAFTRGQLSEVLDVMTREGQNALEAAQNVAQGRGAAISGQGTPSPAGGARKATPDDHAFIDRLLGRQ